MRVGEPPGLRSSCDSWRIGVVDSVFCGLLGSNNEGFVDSGDTETCMRAMYLQAGAFGSD